MSENLPWELAGLSCAYLADEYADKLHRGHLVNIRSREEHAAVTDIISEHIAS